MLHGFTSFETSNKTLRISYFTARGSVVSIVSASSKTVITIAHEPLHLAWWNFTRTCTLTTARTAIEYQGHTSNVNVTWFFVFLACMILLEPVGLDSQNVIR